MNNNQAVALEKATTTLPLKECLQITRFNYRVISASDLAELKTFATRLQAEGQLTPIRIAILSEEALQNEQLQELCENGNQLLIDGERRLCGMEIANQMNTESFASVKVEFIPVHSLPQFLSLQIAFNMDRKNTSFVEDGLAFKRYIEHGGKKRDLLSTMQFPAGMNSRKARMQYITERIDLVALHPSLHPFLNSGILKAYKSKPHQGYLVMGMEQDMQEALAKEFQETPVSRSDDSLLGFFNRFRVAFEQDSVPFNTKDENLGIEEYGTKACTGCRYLKTVQEKNWREEVIEQTYCYQSKCYQAKKEKQITVLATQLADQKIPFVLLNEQYDNGWGGKAAEEELENGQKMIRYYEIVKQGSCPHIVAGIPDGSHYSQSLPKGKILHVCPVKSKCRVHHPQKQQLQESKRSERIVQEKQNTERSTRMLTAIEWGKQLLHQDTCSIKEEIQEQFLLYGFEALYRASSSDVLDTFSILLEIKEGAYFKTHPIKELKKSLNKYGKEQSYQALLLAHLFHDYDQHWETIVQWGKQTNLDFTKMYQQNLDLSMEELEIKHQKRQQGWQEKEQTLRNKIHALYFKLPYQVGIWNWKSKKHILKVLNDEAKGRKACRLVGISLKDTVYLPEQILQKLKGKKAELDLLFPEFSLSQQETYFLEVYRKVSSGKGNNPVPTEWNSKTGIAVTFLKACIEVAIEVNKPIAVASFITTTLDEERITLPLLHSDCKTIIRKVSKQQKVEHEIDKEKRQVQIMIPNTGSEDKE